MYNDASLIISPCQAHINLAKITHNYNKIAKDLDSNAQVMCIIKSDAYGHGLIHTAKALSDAHAPSFGVGTVQEGLALRKNGIKQDILILLGALNAEEMQLAMKYNLTVLVYNAQGLKLAASQDKSIGMARIAIKCETGMSRLGFCPEDMESVLDFLSNQNNLDVRLMLTHISCADMPSAQDMVHSQISIFAELSKKVKSSYPDIQLSICNSAATLAYSNLSQKIGANIFRLGISLYGGNPFVDTIWQNKGEGLLEAMQISTPILHISSIKSGQSIGYGALYTATKDMTIAVLGIGYADGFSRSLSSATGKNGAVCVNGQIAPICGKVCMGMIMVDISNINNVEIGQKVWIINGSQDEFSAQNLAKHWQTIPYEVFCMLGKNTRVYV